MGVTGVTIVQNFVTGNLAVSRGAGIFCQSVASGVIKDNVVSGNHDDGIYCDLTCGPDLLVANNTVLHHVDTGAWGTPAGIYCKESNPTLRNNIVAYNDYGIFAENCEPLPSLDYNCVADNGVGYQPPQGLAGANDTQESPVFAQDGYHIQPVAPCHDGGTNAAADACDSDIDGQERIQGDPPATVEIGADESSGCVWYDFTVTAAPDIQLAGQYVDVTANVFDPVLFALVEGHEVTFSIDGEGGSLEPPPGDGGTWLTDEDGNAVAQVTSDRLGIIIVTAESVLACEGESLAKSVEAHFYEEVASSGERQDWPMFMRDIRHTGFLNQNWSPTAVVLQKEWEVPTPTSNAEHAPWDDHHNPAAASGSQIFYHPYIDSSPIAVGPLVIVGTWSGNHAYHEVPSLGSVRCYDALSVEDLEEDQDLWTTSVGGGIASAPCVHEGRVYIGSADGYLYCLRMTDGDVRWARETLDRDSQTSKILASPVVYNDVVYVGNEASIIYAFEAGTGQPVLPFPRALNLEATMDTEDYDTYKNRTGVSSAAIATAGGAHYLVFGCDDGYLYRIDLASPEVPGEDDRIALTGCVESSPSVYNDGVDSDDDAIFVGATMFEGYCFFKLTIDPFEKVEEMALSPADEPDSHECRTTAAISTVVSPHSVYVGADTGHDFHRVRAAGGAFADVVTSFGTYDDGERYFVGSAAVTSGGLVFVGNDNGFLYVLDAEVTDPDKWKKKEDPDNLYGVVCCSPALSTNVDGTGQLWLFITSRYNGGTLWAFTVHKDPS